jgi:hypothetical protein
MPTLQDYPYRQPAEPHFEEIPRPDRPQELSFPIMRLAQNSDALRKTDCPHLEGLRVPPRILSN